MISWAYDNLLGILLYYIPMMLCAINYTIKTISNYIDDVRYCKECNDKCWIVYVPTDTVGSVTVRVLICMIPGINIWYAISTSYAAISSRLPIVINKVNNFMNMPIVPYRGR